MKKVLLFFLLAFCAFLATGQVLTPCEQAFSLGSSPVCKDSTWTFSGEQWFSFVADSSSLSIHILNSADTTDGHAHVMILYGGVCGSEVQIAIDTLTAPADNLLQIDTTIFIPGNTYLIQVLNNGIGCDKGCGEEISAFQICVQSGIELAPNIFNLRFDTTVCGLDYVQQSIVITTRNNPNNPGFGMPQTVNFAGIPTNTRIIKAFIWFSAIGTAAAPAPVPFLFNTPIGVSNPVANLVQSDLALSGTCWGASLAGFSSTYTYFSDVTAFVAGSNISNQLNGNYTIDNIPMNTVSFNATGATLMLIYAGCSGPGARPSRIVIHDGLDVQNRSTYNPNPVTYNVNLAPPAFNVNFVPRAFAVVSDVQDSTTYFSLNGSATFPVIPMAGTGMYNFLELSSPVLPQIPSNANAVPVLITPSQFSISQDCYSVPMFGVYFQDKAGVCDPIFMSLGSDTFYCPAGSGPPLVLGIDTTNGCLPLATYIWSPSTGLSCTTCPNPVASPSSSINYILTITDCQGCVATDTVRVNVVSLPSAQISGPASNPCDGQPIIYSGPANPNVVYTWIVDYTTPTFPNADFTVSSNNPSVLVPWDEGGWTIILTTCYSNLSGCCSSDTIFIDRCCPCPTGSYCFSNNDANTIISAFGNSLVSAGADPIVINGLLDVNANLTLTGFDGNTGTNDIRLSTNAKIIIRSGVTLTIDDCLLRDNCFKMWDGIYIEDQSAKLIIRNGSTATGAKNAVVSQQGGVYELTNSIFENNNKCVVVQPFAGTHQGFIRTCIFRTNTSVLFPQALPPLPGNPVRNDVGVEITSVNYITIGDASQNAFTNIFDNMDFGVRCTTSLNVRVVNNLFRNIFAGVPSFSGVAVFAIGNPAVDPPPYKLIVGGTAANEPNTFTNCIHGIFATTGMNLDVFSNSLTNTVTNGTNGIVSMASQDAIINIVGNSVNRFRTGIWCLDDQGAIIDIQFNILNLTSVVPMTFGIRMENAVLGGVDANIRQNEIRKCLTGIFMINYTTFGSMRPRIRYNNIGFDMTTTQLLSPPASPRFGIRVVASPGAFVDVNDVTRNYSTIVPAKYISGPLPTALIDLRLVGIYVQNSANCIVSNNNVARMGSGVIMDAQNPGAMLTCNNFYRNYHAFHFGPIITLPFYTGTTNIGTNQFAGLANDNVYRFAITGFANSVSSCDLFGTCGPTPVWNYRTLPSYTPSNCSPLFITLNGVGPLSLTACDPIGPPLAPLVRQSSWQGVIQNLITYQQFNSENQLNGRRIAFRYFKDNQGVLTLNSADDTTYQNFFNAQLNSTVGQFENVLSEIYAGNIGNAANTNNAISPACNIEYYRKTVNAIYLNTWANGIREFSSADSATLYMIAYGDPTEWGDAVYSAQVMMGIYPDASNPLREMETELEQEMEEGNVFPNPNDGNMTVIYNVIGDAEFQIVDLVGKLICSYKLSSEQTKIEVRGGSFGNGVYLYKIIDNGIIIRSNKIVIIK